MWNYNMCIYIYIYTYTDMYLYICVCICTCKHSYKRMNAETLMVKGILNIGLTTEKDKADLVYSFSFYNYNNQ